MAIMPTIDVSIRSVKTFRDSLKMARIRNTGREYMTNDRSKIGPFRQWLWFYGTYLAVNGFTINAYLLSSGNEDVGYGLIRLKNRKWWVTGVIHPRYRGEGYGQLLFHFLTQTAPKPVFLEVLKTNEVAISLYTKLGYVIYDDKPDRWVMRYE